MNRATIMKNQHNLMYETINILCFLSSIHFTFQLKILDYFSIIKNCDQ